MVKNTKLKTVIYYFSWLLIWLAFGGIVTALTVVYTRHISDPSVIYGEWLETNAPSYDTDTFIIKENGIFTNNRMITSQYEFNGSKLSYYIGDTLYSYQIVDRDKTLMKRSTPHPARIQFVKKGSLAHHKIINPEPKRRPKQNN